MADIKKSNNKIVMRQNRQKELFIECIEQFPIIQLACKKAGVPRSTYYRWIEEDCEFAKKIEEAKFRGVDTMNDLAEANIISGIKNGNVHTSIYWLNRNKYKNVSMTIKNKKSRVEFPEVIITSYSEDNDDEGDDYLPPDNNLIIERDDD